MLTLLFASIILLTAAQPTFLKQWSQTPTEELLEKGHTYSEITNHPDSA